MPITNKEINNILHKLKNTQHPVGFFVKHLGKFVSYSYEFLSEFDYWDGLNVSSVEDIIKLFKREEITFNKIKIITPKKASNLYAKKNYIKREKEEKYSKDFFKDIRKFLRTERIFFITPKIDIDIIGNKSIGTNNQYYDINGHIVFSIKLNKHYTNYPRLQSVLEEDFLKNKGYCNKVSRVEVKDNTLNLEIW